MDVEKVVDDVIRELRDGGCIVKSDDWNVWYKKTKAVGCEFIELTSWQEFIQSLNSDKPFIIHIDREARVFWYWYCYNAQGMAVYVVFQY